MSKDYCIDRIGEYPLLNPYSEFTYRNTTHALHLYGYSAIVKVDAREFKVQPGDLSFIESGSIYSITTEKPEKHWCIHFQDTTDNQLQGLHIRQHLPLGHHSLHLREQIKQISSLFNRIDNTQQAKFMRVEADYRFKALLISLHCLSHQKASPTRSQSSVSWPRLLEWIDQNLETAISGSRLAEQVNLSPNTLSRKFKEEFQMTINQYLLHKRIDRAKSLLSTTTMTIFEIGSSVGIPDPQYFNKQFRRVSGMSPSYYRETNQGYSGEQSAQIALKEGRWNREP